MPLIRRTALTGALLAGAALLCAPQPATAQRSRCRAHEVNLSPPDGRVGVNATTPILATTYDAAGNPCDNVTYTWSSSSPSVATVDRGGIVRGVAVGTATITARTGVGAAAKIGRATVTVEEATEVTTQGVATDSVPGLHRRDHPAGQGMAAIDRQPDGAGPADNLNVDPLQVVLIRGERRSLEFRALKADGSPAAPVPIVFQVDPGGERIASVDTFGLISALTDTGTATVKLTVPGQSRIQPRIVRVTVRNDTVQFSRRELTLAPGMVETLSVYVPQQQRALPPQLFQYSSSDGSKLQVNPGQPILTAVAPGTVRVTATNAYLPDFTATVHIHRRVRAIALAPTDRPLPADSTVIVPIGGSVTLRARALAADDGTDVPEAPITWRMPDASVVALDTAHGTVRGLRSGLAVIYVSTLTTRDSQATATVRVKVVAGGLSTPRTRIGLGIGEHTSIEVALLDEQRNSAGSALPYLRWSTPDSAARVENDNQIVGLRLGHARLTGRTSWDSTIAVDVYVVPDLLAIGRQQGRQGVMALSTSGQVLGFAPDSLVEFLAWSPDLTRIAATAQVNPLARVPTATLTLFNADGSAPTRLTDDSAYARYPVFVPGLSDSSEIVFEWNKGGRAQIWKVDLHGSTPGTPQQLTTTPTANTAPAVSPDGRRIAYVSVRETSPGRAAYGLYQANIDGSEEHLVFGVPQGHRILGSPSFSVDGRSLLFVRGEPTRQGLPTQRVCRIAVTAQSGDTVAAVTPLDIVVAAFSQSADGQTLALNTLEPLSGGSFNRHLVLFTVNGGTRVPVDTPEMRPASPLFRPATPAAPRASQP